MKTDRAKHDRLAKEENNAKADLQRQINAPNAQISDLQLNRPKNWEQSQKKRTLLEKKVNQLDAVISTHPAMIQVAVNEQSEKFAPHDSIKAALQAIDKMLVALVEEEKSDIIERDTSQTMSKSITDEIEDEISLEGNVKECNAMIIELDEKFYVKFAQFEQQQKEMDQNTMKTINVRTDQSKRKIVIRTPPEDEAQCFDVACENVMAKMENSPISPCLYPHKTENEADTVESEFFLFLDHCRVPEGLRLPRLRRSEDAHWQRGAVSKVLREVPETAQLGSEMTSYKQKTRTREMYSRERLNDDGDVASGGGPDG